MDSVSLGLSLLSPDRRRSLEGIDREGLEEFHLRVGRALSLVYSGRERDWPGPEVTGEEVLRVLEKATGASLHRAAPALSQGYIPYRGLRIGTCATAIYDGDRLAGFEGYSSLAIRLPKELPGICDEFYNDLIQARPRGLLIISPPGYGKTTLLRELIRRLAQDGNRVAVLDQRNELSATWEGRAAFNLGRCSDVLVGMDKARGAELLLRAMGPGYIAMDEISGEEDMKVIEFISGCGVGVLATAHAGDRQDLLRRPAYRAMVKEGYFDHLLVIERRGRDRRYSLEALG